MPTDRPKIKQNYTNTVWIRFGEAYTIIEKTYFQITKTWKLLDKVHTIIKNFNLLVSSYFFTKMKHHRQSKFNSKNLHLIRLVFCNKCGTKITLHLIHLVHGHDALLECSYCETLFHILFPASLCLYKLSTFLKLASHYHWYLRYFQVPLLLTGMMNQLIWHSAYLDLS